jgi:hypothetical protein
MGNASDSHHPGDKPYWAVLFPGNSESRLSIRAWEFVAAVFAVCVGVILVLLLFRLATGETTTHGDLSLRLMRIEQQVSYNTCLILLPERTPLAITECQPLLPLDSSQ